MLDHTVVPLGKIIEEAISPLDSLADILREGGYEDIAVVSFGLIRDSRSKLHMIVRCLEAGCGKPLLLQDLGGVLAPVPCRKYAKKEN